MDYEVLQDEESLDGLHEVLLGKELQVCFMKLYVLDEPLGLV